MRKVAQHMGISKLFNDIIASQSVAAHHIMYHIVESGNGIIAKVPQDYQPTC